MSPTAQGECFQLGYVTRDLSRAVALFQERYGVSGFLEFDTATMAPAGSPGPFIKVALGYSRGVMIELIQLCPDNPGIYGDALRDDGGVNLHHLGYLMDQSAFDTVEAGFAAQGVAVPVVNRSGGMCLLYADTRRDSGLFTEIVVPTGDNEEPVRQHPTPADGSVAWHRGRPGSSALREMRQLKECSAPPGS